MGVKQGTFYTNDGDIVAVSFFGEKVETGDIRLASSPVIIQMDGGGGEYIPVQYATASIACITNGLALFDLCTQEPLDIAVEVYNRNTEQVIFAGYVTPNTFNQSIDDLNVVITIECVDWLGIAKYVPYRQLSSNSLTLSTFTIGEAVNYIAGILWREPIRVLFSDFVNINNQNIESDYGQISRETNEYYKLRISESYFFNNPTSPELIDDSLSIEYNAVSCYEALSMLAESFRGTFVACGLTLILNDVVTQLDGGQRFIELSTGDYVNMGKNIAVKNDSFANRGSVISALPVYNDFALTRRKEETPLTISLSGTVKKRQSWQQDYSYDDNGIRREVYVQNLESPLFYTQHDYPDAFLENLGIASLWAYKDFEIRGDMKPLTTWDNSWEVAIRVAPTPSALQGSVYIGLKGDYVMPVVESRAYSLKLSMSITCGADKEDSARNHFSPHFNTRPTYFPSVIINIGDYFYNAASGQWETELVSNSLSSNGGSDAWVNAFLFINEFPQDTLTDSTKDGRVSCYLYFNNDYNVWYVKDLALTLVGEPRFSKSIPDTMHKTTGNPRHSYDNVTTPITFGLPKTQKSFSTKINDIDYAYITVYNSISGRDAIAYGKLCFIANDLRYTMLERVERMANMGDRKEFTFNLKDPHSAIFPVDTFTSPLWLGDKVCVAYQRDVERNSINVTLN